MSRERALLRLGQLSRELRVAMGNADVEMVCRIAALIPLLIEGLRTTPAEPTPEARAVLLDAADACRAAEAFLQARLRVTASSLQRISQGRRAVHAYARRTTSGARLGGVTG